MIKRVKQWLGIEGVKLELDLPEGQSLANKSLFGHVRLRSLNTQTVTEIRVELIERYGRGRGEDRKVDEYKLGGTVLSTTFVVPANETIEHAFRIQFEPLQSNVDRWADRNPINRQLAKAARKLRGIDSQYIVYAEARVKGVALNPFDKKTIELS